MLNNALCQKVFIRALVYIHQAVCTVGRPVEGETKGSLGLVSAPVGERQPVFHNSIVNLPAFAAHAALGDDHAVHIHQLGVVKDVDVDEVAGVGGGDEAVGVAAQEVVAGGDPVTVENVVVAGQRDVFGIALQDGVILAVGDVVPADELAGVFEFAVEDVGRVADGEAAAEAIFAGEGDLRALRHGEDDALQAGIAALHLEGQGLILVAVQVGTVIAKVVEGVEGGADGLFAGDLEVIDIAGEIGIVPVNIVAPVANTQQNLGGAAQEGGQIVGVAIGALQIAIDIEGHPAGGKVRLNMMPRAGGDALGSQCIRI